MGWILMMGPDGADRRDLLGAAVLRPGVPAFAWNVLIVYLTLGFRHYSHYFTSIQFALNAGDEPPRARCWPNGRASTRSAWTRPRSPASPSKNR
jgi:hypothetical protein